ncbi:hypothetical protein Rhe02_33020 [Rhizocola hellebori]|uniref:STAS domain-containing protein n=1 Tax=Rhizocola hellebori TaxID=1392758 RepID=A0A8J3Q7G5_9ACTN|nr:hypothetical protein [Rhizocola hellebori]GIH05235.1 hypothetical protein Rhe02_33020 [Rhizocola hellebori]
MNPLLHMRIRLEAHQITLAAIGQLTALTAHLLPKVVIGTLRRYATGSLHLDLSAITVVDYVGVVAIEDCEHETSRRGLALTISLPQIDQTPVAQLRPGARRTKWMRPMFNTGTICRQRTSMR